MASVSPLFFACSVDVAQTTPILRHTVRRSTIPILPSPAIASAYLGGGQALPASGRIQACAADRGVWRLTASSTFIALAGRSAILDLKISNIRLVAENTQVIDSNIC
jgi:hypothetical protein